MAALEVSGRRFEVDAAMVDLDGTMVDTLGDFTEALGRMLAELGLPAIGAGLIEQMVGKGSEHLLNSVLNRVLGQNGQAIDATEIEALYARAWPAYQRRFRAFYGQYAQIYPGVLEGME